MGIGCGFLVQQQQSSSTRNVNNFLIIFFCLGNEEADRDDRFFLLTLSLRFFCPTSDPCTTLVVRSLLLNHLPSCIFQLIP